MTRENDITAKTAEIAQLEEQGDIESLQALESDAEAEYQFDVMGLANAAIERLKNKGESGTKEVITSTGELQQVEDLGGSSEAAEEIVAPIDEEIVAINEEIKDVKAEAEAEIRAVENSQEQDLDQEKQQKIESLIEKMQEKRKELKDIYHKKEEHQQEVDSFLENKGYTKDKLSLLESMKFYNDQVTEELFSNKEMALVYFSKLLEISVNEPDSYKRKIQDVMRNFEDQKANYEAGRGGFPTPVYELLDKYADKLNNQNITSSIKNGEVVTEKYKKLQNDIENDVDLLEIENRHKAYNQLNDTTMKELELQSEMGRIEREAKELGYKNPF